MMMVQGCHGQCCQARFSTQCLSMKAGVPLWLAMLSAVSGKGLVMPGFVHLCCVSIMRTAAVIARMGVSAHAEQVPCKAEVEASKSHYSTGCSIPVDSSQPL